MEVAVAARLMADPGVVEAPLAGVRRFTVGGAPTGEMTSTETWTSRAVPALSVARADSTYGRESSPAARAGAV